MHPLLWLYLQPVQRPSRAHEYHEVQDLGSLHVKPVAPQAEGRFKLKIHLKVFP